MTQRCISEVQSTASGYYLSTDETDLEVVLVYVAYAGLTSIRREAEVRHCDTRRPGVQRGRAALLWRDTSVLDLQHAMHAQPASCAWSLLGPVYGWELGFAIILTMAVPHTEDITFR